MYDRLGPNDEDYSRLRMKTGKDALVTDAFNRAFEIFIHENKMCLFDAVEEAVDETLTQRDAVMDEACAVSPQQVEKELRSELRRSPLTTDGLPQDPRGD